MILVALAGAGVSAAQAQDAAGPADSGGLESADEGLAIVTVSARRREEDAQDVPIPIAAIDGKSLESVGQFRLEDLNQRCPAPTRSSRIPGR
jgi:iron complex outermembrane receptor protein